jgi:hypothetical protein
VSREGAASATSLFIFKKNNTMKNILFALTLIFTLGSYGQTIFEVSRNGDLEKLKELYASDNAIINTADSKGFTPLILAAYNEQDEIVTYLLENGSDVNAKDLSGNTALMGVCFKGYFDTQRHRLGPNFQQLKINQPLEDPKNYNSDSWNSAGNKRFENPDVNYQPSEKSGLVEDEQYKQSETTLTNVTITQKKITKTNDFAQPGDFYRSLTKDQQDNLIKNLSGDLGQVTDKNIQMTMIGYFYQADRDYGMRIAEALGFSAKDFMKKK